MTSREVLQNSAEYVAEAPLYCYGGDRSKIVPRTVVVFFMVKFSITQMTSLGLVKVIFTEVLQTSF